MAFFQRSKRKKKGKTMAIWLEHTVEFFLLAKNKKIQCTLSRQARHCSQMYVIMPPLGARAFARVQRFQGSLLFPQFARLVSSELSMFLN